MAKYYIISPAEADLIGKFTIDDCNGVDPYCGEQNDGNYVISEDVVVACKNHANIKKVDFASKTSVEESSLDFKPRIENPKA